MILIRPRENLTLHGCDTIGLQALAMLDPEQWIDTQRAHLDIDTSVDIGFWTAGNDPTYACAAMISPPDPKWNT